MTRPQFIDNGSCKWCTSSSAYEFCFGLELLERTDDMTDPIGGRRWLGWAQKHPTHLSNIEHTCSPPGQPNQAQGPPQCYISATNHLLQLRQQLEMKRCRRVSFWQPQSHTSPKNRNWSESSYGTSMATCDELNEKPAAQNRDLTGSSGGTSSTRARSRREGGISRPSTSVVRKPSAHSNVGNRCAGR